MIKIWSCVLLLYLVVAQVVNYCMEFPSSIHPIILEQSLKENRTISSHDDPWFWRIDTFWLHIFPLLLLVLLTYCFKAGWRRNNRVQLDAMYVSTDIDIQFKLMAYYRYRCMHAAARN